MALPGPEHAGTLRPEETFKSIISLSSKFFLKSFWYLKGHYRIKGDEVTFLHHWHNRVLQNESKHQEISQYFSISYLLVSKLVFFI